MSVYSEIKEIKNELKIQDNCMTLHPIFMIQQQIDNERWEPLQMFFTDKAAKEFIARNQKHYKNLRIYVKSGHRNPEWQAIRNFLLTF